MDKENFKIPKYQKLKAQDMALGKRVLAFSRTKQYVFKIFSDLLLIVKML